MLTPLNLKIAAGFALTTALVYGIWRAADMIGDAREHNVERAIEHKGASDADAVIRGEHDVRACRAAGGVWSLARARCEHGQPGL